MSSLHVKLAIRQLKKNRSFSLLNIFGLALGLTTFLLIVLYIADEWSFDRWNTNADRIVRLHTDLLSDGRLSQFADAAPPVGPILKRDYPEVANATRCLPEDDIRFRFGSQDMTEHHVASVDPAFFDIFTLPAIEGNPAVATEQPRTAVLTASAAMRYFNTTHAVGKTLARLDDTLVYKVVAVIKDLPKNASFNYDIFLSLRGSDMEKNHNFWAIYRMSTFVLLRPGTDQAAFNTKLAGMMGKYLKDYSAMEAQNGGKWYFRIGSMPLTKIHLYSHRLDELAVNSDIQYVYIFSAIAVFVLLIAGINFMNLSTARSANRAREVGVRKVLGSARGALIGQFLAESLLLTAAAAGLALMLTRVTLPAFNHLTGKAIAFDGATLRWLLPALGMIIIILGLFSGAWPAFFLSSFRPVQVLKSKLGAGKGGGLRNGLVVGQFAISIFLIVGTGVVYRQLTFIQHRDPGYNRDQVLVIKDLDALPHPEALKQQIQQLAGVTGVTGSDFIPTGTRRWHNWGVARIDSPKNIQTELWVVDKDYIPTMGMHIATGRNFSAAMGTDTSAIILNEAAARMFGIAKDPIGKTIHYAAYLHHPTDFTVIGVVRDFNYTSIRNAVQPLVLVNRPADVPPGFSIRIAAGHTPDVLAQVKNLFSTYAPAVPFHYSFMDDDFDAIYTAEQRMGTVTLVLTALAIGIACLGLFGLAAYAAEQRAKEIGIRKILGAEVSSIVALLSKDFGRLIVLAFVIATPIAGWGMHRWLENFAYRTTISPWLFAAAAAIIGLAAALTTLFQSLKAAVANPVESLRSE
ncbi:MAG TPA: ABC transporter permease [Puia sp.]|uniref:ABC transporter permease n=1 Tax=Puia sp. TaxID=2045100 RepID=UPI002C1AFF20|nr:ABC transporter permease [Puia sp.]HVU95407.1 ABC transporter permease [Puia sp.]